MCVRQGSIVTVLKPKSLSITATCFEYRVYGRGTGLKIRYAVELRGVNFKSPVAVSGRGQLAKTKKRNSRSSNAGCLDDRQDAIANLLGQVWPNHRDEDQI